MPLMYDMQGRKKRKAHNTWALGKEKWKATINILSLISEKGKEEESDDAINPLRDEVARDTEADQASRDAPEPGEVAFVVLARHPDVPASKRCVSGTVIYC